MNGLGPTGFYGEYGWFKDYVSAVDDSGGDASALVLDLGGVAGDRIGGSTAEVWGFGVVQHIEAAEMQLYAGYRLNEVDFEIVSGGAAVTNELEDFHTVVFGSKIAF